MKRVCFLIISALLVSTTASANEADLKAVETEIGPKAVAENGFVMSTLEKLGCPMDLSSMTVKALSGVPYPGLDKSSPLGFDLKNVLLNAIPARFEVSCPGAGDGEGFFIGFTMALRRVESRDSGSGLTYVESGGYLYNYKLGAVQVFHTPDHAREGEGLYPYHDEVWR